MKKTTRVGSLVISFMQLLLTSVFAGVAGLYYEDFSTKQTCDTLHTTALWDTTSGELVLPPFELIFAGSISTPGDSRAVVIEGDHAFVAERYAGMRIININDPANPVLVSVYNTSGIAYGLAVEGNYAYITDDADGVHVVDISDLNSPSLVGSYNTVGYAYDVEIAGNYAYVADYDDGGLQVIDISDPANPFLAGVYDTPGSARGVKLAGDYCFVADLFSGLQVIDISDPTHPFLAGSYDTPGQAVMVDIAGNHAFVADWDGGLQVIDISDPANPFLAGSHATQHRASDVAITGDHLYLADTNSGLLWFDISDPANPALLGGYDTDEQAVAVALSGEHAFVADYDGGLVVVDIADPVPLTQVGMYSGGGDIVDMCISGDHAYQLIMNSVLRVMDISDPAQPTAVGSTGTPGLPHIDLVVSGNMAYVLGKQNKLLVHDVSDPTNPNIIATYLIGDDIRSIVISGDFAFVSAGDTLHVVDISNPSAPLSAGNYASTADLGNLAISGDFIFVSRPGGVDVIDISSPVTPTFAGGLNLPGPSGPVTVWGDVLYAGNNILDISDPVNPVQVGSYTGVSISVIVGDRGFGGSGGYLAIFDISNPVSPQLLDSYWVSDILYSIAVEGDHVFLGYASGDFRVMQTWERSVHADQNVAQSTMLAGAGYVTEMKLTPEQAGSVQWEASADGGAHWQVITDTDWYTMAFPGSAPMWRATLLYPQAGDHPVVDAVTVETRGSPVAVLIQAFKARGTESGVELSWNIETDEEIAGFRIYRSSGDTDPDVVVNSGGLISADSRSYTDTGAPGDGRTYRYALAVVNADGSEVLSTTVTAKTAGRALALHQNHPNPFNPSTTISFVLPEKAGVDLSIFNLQGQLINRLVEGIVDAGVTDVVWDGSDATGNPVASGVYFYRLQSGNTVQTKKMILLK